MKAAGRLLLVGVYFQTCAIVDGGEVLCWGDTLAGGAVLRVPTKIPDVDDAVSLSADEDEMCIQRRDHEPTCWHSVVQPPRRHLGTRPDRQ